MELLVWSENGHLSLFTPLFTPYLTPFSLPSHSLSLTFTPQKPKTSISYSAVDSIYLAAVEGVAAGCPVAV